MRLNALNVLNILAGTRLLHPPYRLPRLLINNATINTTTTITTTAATTQVGVAPCVGFVNVLDVVGVVTELVEELVVVVAVVTVLVEALVEVFTELVVVARLLVVVVVVIVVVVVVVVDWFVGCGSGCIAMYIEPWPFVMFTSPNHARYSVLSMIDALGIIVNAVV